MNRYLTNYIINDLNDKIVILSGPRQTGKTTLSKMLSNNYDYINYDYPEHRTILKEKSWDRKKELIIFDEIHKMSKWKSYLKGIYDVEGILPKIIVTGSARLDMIKKSGDSLAGRYFYYRLHPLDIKEVKDTMTPDEALNRLINVSGFPEPFLKNDKIFYRRWKRTYTDIILRHDLIDLENIRDIKSIETLIELLRNRVGSPVSYLSLARDLQKDSKTVKRWIDLLENLFILFPVRPYHKNIARAILKEPKYYFYDTAFILGNEGVKIENIVALSILKEINFIEDTLGLNASLNYLRTKDGKEIDFIVSIENKMPILIEVKLSDENLTKNFIFFEKYFDKIIKIQLVKNLKKEKTFNNNTEIRKLSNWLANINLT